MVTIWLLLILSSEDLFGGFGYDLSCEDIFWRILLLLILSGEDLSEDSVTICQVRTSLGDSFGYY